MILLEEKRMSMLYTHLQLQLLDSPTFSFLAINMD